MHCKEKMARLRRVLWHNSSQVSSLVSDGRNSAHRLFSRSWEFSMGDMPDNDFITDFNIPDYILIPGSEVINPNRAPTCPVIVFINSKSGGQLGSQLLVTYRSILNEKQVFDLGEKAPDKVLHDLYVTLELLKGNGDTLAIEILKRLRIIVAGGDGTAGWLLGVISDLKLPNPPPIATVPLGTGNNLPFSFGWGKKNPGTDKQSVLLFLNQVSSAKEMKIDSWHIIMKMKAPKEASCDPIAPLELPHSLHAFRRVSQKDSMDTEFQTFRGGFWNYFSMGMDAQVSYAFHTERKLHPEKFKNQFSNQSAYLKLGCTQGWFCASLFHPSSRNIAQLAKITVMRKNGKWEELVIPRSIRSIVCLNLPSFSGGLNPWGWPNTKKIQYRDLTPPYVDDGLVEIVGFRNGWHGLVLLAPQGHGTRLAQTNRVRLEFHKGAADHTFMRIDGEPWKQPLPVEDDTVMVEISNSGQVTMLATQDCPARSLNDPATTADSYYYHTDDDDDDDDEEEEKEKDDGDDDHSPDDNNWELERTKFGAANTFRIPDGVEIQHLN